jgi:hypothetical protein
MIPAPPEFRPPRRECRPRPAASAAPAPAPSPRPSPRRKSRADPRPAASPAPTLAAKPAPRGHRPQLAPRLTTQTSPTLPPRHKRFRPTTPPPFLPGLTPPALAMPVGCRAPSTLPVHPARHHAYLSPLTPQPDGYLSPEQFNECGALPDRFSRAPHSLKASSRGGVAAEVSGGREDDAAGGTGQGSGIIPGGTRRSASCRARRRIGRSATLKTPRHAAPSPGDVKFRPFGESYRTVRWAGSRGYGPGSGRGRACMATLELRILRRFAWSCG